MSKSSKKNISLFGNVRVLCITAILTASAVVIAYVCKALTFGPIRITFENIPIILAGYMFGPIAGLVCGLASDFLNTAVSHYGLSGMNLIITAGAGLVGFCAGLFSRILKNKKRPLRLAASVLCAHIVGNIIVKSLGLIVYYSYPMEMIIIRIPLYLGIAAVEYLVLLALLASKGIRGALGGLESDL